MNLLYRKIRYRKGHGVHSPFVYNLITKVIEERCPYYRFYDIELVRKQLLHKGDISPKHGALLFRLTNYFKPQYILQIGSSLGLSTLYLTSYKPGVKCISLENKPESVSQWVYEKEARTSIDRRVGEYKDLLPGALEEMPSLDFVFFHIKDEQNLYMELFNECIKHSNNDTIFVLEGIKANRDMRNVWKEIGACPEVTVTIDLYSMGIVFFNKKLHKRNYIVYF